MGLASKLAAANSGASGAPAGGYPPPQQQQYGAPPPPPRPGTGGGYPGQQQYQAYNPQGGYGQQPPYPAGGQAGGAPPPLQNRTSPQAYRDILVKAIRENGLSTFYPPNSPALDQIAQRAVHQIPQLAQRWRVPMEIANDLVQLGLYDIVIFVDDSGSMQFEEAGERIKDLQLILERVTSIATIFDDDGVSLRFMNANYQQSMLENIKTEQQIQQIMSTVQYKGLTPMGTELRKKVLDGIIFPKLRNRTFSKPHLVIVVTDGQPAGEAPGAVFETIKLAGAESTKAFGQGTNAITFQFAQVGNDLKAREFLGKLDEDPTIGNIIDCTSNYENESDEMRKMGQDLSPEMWLVKLMLGAIDSSYDSKDEASAPPRPGQGGQFGAPPQGGYGGGQYGGPPGGFAPPPGPPPSGGYGQQQYPPQQGGANYGGSYRPQGGNTRY